MWASLFGSQAAAAPRVVSAPADPRVAPVDDPFPLPRPAPPAMPPRGAQGTPAAGKRLSPHALYDLAQRDTRAAHIADAALRKSRAARIRRARGALGLSPYGRTTPRARGSPGRRGLQKRTAIYKLKQSMRSLSPTGKARVRAKVQELERQQKDHFRAQREKKRAEAQLKKEQQRIQKEARAAERQIRQEKARLAREAKAEARRLKKTEAKARKAVQKQKRIEQTGSAKDIQDALKDVFAEAEALQLT